MQLLKIINFKIFGVVLITATCFLASLVYVGKANAASGTPASSAFPTSLYNSYGFPNPTAPKQMSEDTLYRWNNYLKPHAQKAAALVGIDAGFIGMWPYLESQFSSQLDNCGDLDHDPNTLCDWRSTLWQVGWGIFPEFESVYLKEAIEKMRPGESVQQVGQRVVLNSESFVPGGTRCPKDEWYEANICSPYDKSYKFPNVTSVDDLIARGHNGDLEAQKQVATLMKDDAVGAYIVAKKFKNYVDNNTTTKVADLMASWPPHTTYQPQSVVNYLAGIYSAGVAGGTTSSGIYKSQSNPVKISIGKPAFTPGNIPPITGNPRDAVFNQFRVNIMPTSFSEEYSRWAWEFLWKSSNTTFDERIRGTTVSRNDEGSRQTGCKSISIRGTYDQETFNIVFAHEMGHIILNCTDNNYKDAHNNARANEGQLTIYSKLLCTYNSYGEWQKESENYAEMIAYYLNPEFDSHTTQCGREPNPYLNGGHPEHHNVAQKILSELPTEFKL